MPFELPSLPPAIRTLTDEESERLNQQYPHLPRPENCITCGGSGTFTWKNPQNGEPAEWKCNCIDQWVLHRYLLFCGIGTHYQRLSWADMTSVEAPAIEKVRHYLTKPGYARQGIGLILHGSIGSGKTSLSALGAKAQAAQGIDVYMTTFASLLDTYASGWRDEDEKKWFYRRVKNASSLWIDDLGREMKGRGGLPTSTLDEILRHRVAASSATSLSANLTLPKIAESYGENIFSLLTQSVTTYEFVGEDFRPQQRLRTAEEVEAGLTRPLVLG